MDEKSIEFYWGVSLAVSSSAFIGSSFIIKKLSLIRISKNGNLRAGAGGFAYLKDWLWWLGFITMGVGELANFAAYAFAPASLVTSLGALSILVSSILSEKFLGEHLNRIGKLSCILCIIGSIIIILHAPSEGQLTCINDLVRKLSPQFGQYVVMVTFVVMFILIYAGPRYGSRYVIVYISLCSAVGSLSVMACKALGLALKELYSNLKESPSKSSSLASSTNSLLIIILGLLIVVVSCIALQMNYLNKALDLFSTNVVTPIYYVLFTSLVLIASAILFKEWQNMSTQNILGSLCGFLVVFVSIFLLNANKEIKDNDLHLNKGLQKIHYGIVSTNDMLC